MCDVAARQSRIDLDPVDQNVLPESCTQPQPVFTIQTDDKLTNGCPSCTDSCLEAAASDDKLPPQEDSSSESDFDPYEFGNEKNATSYWGTVMHMIIVGMSPTLLNLPHTFKQVGYQLLNEIYSNTPPYGQDFLKSVPTVAKVSVKCGPLGRFCQRLS